MTEAELAEQVSNLSPALERERALRTRLSEMAAELGRLRAQADARERTSRNETAKFLSTIAQRDLELTRVTRQLEAMTARAESAEADVASRFDEIRILTERLQALGAELTASQKAKPKGKAEDPVVAETPKLLEETYARHAAALASRDLAMAQTMGELEKARVEILELKASLAARFDEIAVLTRTKLR